MNETPWRSLGETADDFRNADKSEGSRITCSLSDTTGGYHRQGVAYELPPSDYSGCSNAPLKGNGKAQRDSLYRQRVEQRFGLLQIERVEAFGEPTVDRGEKIVGFAVPTLLGPLAGEIAGGAQFK